MSQITKTKMISLNQRNLKKSIMKSNILTSQLKKKNQKKKLKWLITNKLNNIIKSSRLQSLKINRLKTNPILSLYLILLPTLVSSMKMVKKMENLFQLMTTSLTHHLMINLTSPASISTSLTKWIQILLFNNKNLISFHLISKAKLNIMMKRMKSLLTDSKVNT